MADSHSTLLLSVLTTGSLLLFMYFIKLPEVLSSSNPRQSLPLAAHRMFKHKPVEDVIRANQIFSKDSARLLEFVVGTMWAAFLNSLSCGVNWDRCFPFSMAWYRQHTQWLERWLGDEALAAKHGDLNLNPAPT